MNSNWHGLMKIVEIECVGVDGRVIWSGRNINNVLHTSGEEYLLQLLFDNSEFELPTSFYMGLDNRETIAVGDEIDDLTDEPSSGGYLRQTLDSSAGDFTVELSGGVHRARSKIVTFSASGGSWGPVNNIFMASTSDDTGVLIATAPLPQEASLTDGQSINLRMNLSLRDYPV